ncbi:MAG: hypothetical protein MJZ41_14740 [Bacteroidaceae bacterium]|nr:hypothetical protein [Bacteroidaceae bacterium]
MKVSVYLSLFVMLVLLFSCSENRDARALFERVDSLMDEDPKLVLMMLDSASDASIDYPRRQKMRYELLRAKAMNKAYVDFTTDSIMKEVVEYYDNHGTANEKVEAHYLLGCVYRDLHESPAALSCYYDAVECADTLNDECDYGLLMRVYGQIATILENQLAPNEAVKAWKQYSACALKDNDEYGYIRGIELQAGSYYIMCDTIKTLENIYKSHDLYLQKGFKEAAASVYPMAIYVYLDRHDYKEAHRLMTIFERESGLFDKDNNIVKEREHYYYAKGLYYHGINKIDSAILYFHKSIEEYPYFESYGGLMNAWRDKGNVDSAFHYMTLYDNQLNNDLGEINTESAMQTQSMYDYSRNQKIALEKIEEAKKKQTIIFGLIVVFVIVVFILCVNTIKYKAQKQMEIASLNSNYLRVYTLYEKTKEELGQVGDDYSEYKQNVELELIELKEQLKSFDDMYSSLKTNEKIDALRQSPVFQKIDKKLNPRVKDFHLVESDWNDMIIMSKLCLPVFYAKITEKDILSREELVVTILTKIGYTTSSIAVIMDKSVQRITNAKSIANTKLFGDSSARSFSTNIKTL